MRPVILRHKWLFLIGVLCALAGCGHKSPPPAQAEIPPDQSSVGEPPQVPEQAQVAQVSEQEQEPEVEKEPDKEVTVKGYSAIPDDIQKAEEEALMDAYNKAIAQGLGVKVYGKTVVKQFQVVEQVVMTERKGYVKSFEILDRNPESQLGYEVTVKAVVSSEPISELDDLKFQINLMGNPRLMVYIESEDKNRSIIEGYIIGPLSKAGYTLIDRQQMERLKERDFKEKKLLGDWESAAILGNRLGADIAIVGNISTDITTKISTIVVATANVYFKVVAAETGEILYSVTDEDIPNVRRDRQGSGGPGGDAKAMNEATANAARNVAEKLMWELPSKIGLVSVKLLVRDCTYGQAEQLAKLIKPLRTVEDAHLVSFQKPIAEIHIETTSKTQDLVSHLGGFPDMNVEVEGVKLGVIETRLLEIEQAPVSPESN